MEGTLARRVLAVPDLRQRVRSPRARHLAGGTRVEVVRQRLDDSRVVIRLVGDRDRRLYLVPADAIDSYTARLMSIRRPARHLRASGGSQVPVDWKPPEG